MGGGPGFLRPPADRERRRLNVTGIALDPADGEDAMLAGVFTIEGVANNHPHLIYLDQARNGVDGYGGYWIGRLMACGLRLTRPVGPDPAPPSPHDPGLRAQIRVVLETANGDRTPVEMNLVWSGGEDPAWHVTSCCFTSSPFQAAEQAIR